jgi:hypothetical protein
MYSELFKLTTINKEDGNLVKEYIIDYSGNMDIKEIKSKIQNYIKKHGHFTAIEFNEKNKIENLNITYISDLEEITIRY